MKDKLIRIEIQGYVSDIFNEVRRKYVTVSFAVPSNRWYCGGYERSNYLNERALNILRLKEPKYCIFNWQCGGLV